MSMHETVNRRYAELQALLLTAFAAEGRGIIEMLRNVEDRVSPKLAWELRSIGHIRNQVVHEGLAEVPRYFEPLCKEAAAALKQLKAKTKKPRAAAAVKPAVSKTAPRAVKSTVAKPHILASSKFAAAAPKSKSRTGR